MSIMGVIQDQVAPVAAHPKICLLIGTLGLGGAENQLVLLAQQLQEHDVPVQVVTLFETGPHEASLTAAGISVTCLQAGKLSLSPAGALVALKAVWRLRQYVRREKPDVVHAFLFLSYVLAAVVRIPVLVAGRRSMGDFKDGYPFVSFVEALVNRRTRLLIANSEAVAADTRLREGVPPGKIAVVYNGLPSGAFVAAEAAEISDCTGAVIVCVANLLPYKGHRFLLEALGELRRRGHTVTTVLIGDGPERETLTNLASALGLDVRFAGHRTDVPRYLSRADIAVLPSLTEGMSNAIMEAMAAGLPIVATSVGGTPELLSGRGFLVPPADAPAIADAIESVLDRPAEAAELGRLARKFALDRLSAEAMTNAYLKIYRDEVYR